MKSLNNAINNFNRLGETGKLDYVKQTGFKIKLSHIMGISNYEKQFFKYLFLNKKLDDFITDFSIEDAPT